MASPQSLNQLIELTSNVTDAFTTALFVSDPNKKMLLLAGYHSLSLNLDGKARIAYGDGPIGWVAENEKPKENVSPKEAKPIPAMPKQKQKPCVFDEN